MRGGDQMSAERTDKAIVAGTWGCAGIVMAGSATNAFLAYGALGDNRVLGLATGLAVDIGLCVALIGDRRLYAHGLSSNWGRVLRITTAVMSLILNTCISLRDGHYLSASMHAFLPILLVVLTEYGQDVLLKFTALSREAEEIKDRAGSVVSHQPAEPALPTPIVATPAATYEPFIPRQTPAPVATPQPVVARQEPPEVATKPATRRTTKAATTPRQTDGSTPEDRRAWVRQQRDKGISVTGADVHKQFPNSPRDGARIVRQVEAELDRELTAVAAGSR